MATDVASKRKAETLPGDARGGSSGPIVLDEDDWTDRIEAIIERDYFPDIPKLQNKLEWLQASSICDFAPTQYTVLSLIGNAWYEIPWRVCAHF